VTLAASPPDLAEPAPCLDRDSGSWSDRARVGAPKLVLVAENEALIAMGIAYELAEAGLEMAGPFSTCAAATDWLRRHTPDFAILDIELHDGPCTDVASELRRRNVSFAVFSGSSKERAPAIFRQASWFEKPADLKRLIGSLVAGAAMTRESPGQLSGKEAP